MEDVSVPMMLTVLFYDPVDVSLVAMNEYRNRHVVLIRWNVGLGDQFV